MLKIVWFIPRPERELQSAEELYQIGHVRRGMRQENLQRFRINLALLPQPKGVERLTGTSEPAVFRFSEGYWEDFSAIQECYRSPNGLAALADGMLNAVARVPSTPLPILYGEEEDFATSTRLAFDPFAGRYADERPVKLFLFVQMVPENLAAFDKRYSALAPGLGRVAGLGPHILTRFQDLHLQIGASSRWPAAGTETYQRCAEYYFHSADQLCDFTESEAFGAVVGLASELGLKITPVAVDPQEVFFTTVGRQPLSEGWREFYSR